MSNKNKLIAEFERIEASLRGSDQTHYDRCQHLRNFATWAYKDGFQIRSADGIREKHLRQYAAHLQAQGLSKRTLGNRFAALRGVLKSVGKTALAKQVTNKSVGAAGGSRLGNKIALSDEKFTSAHVLAFSKDQGVAACMELERWLGLRGREAVMSCKSLKQWEKDLSLPNNATIIIKHGTKGNRPRESFIPDKSKALTAIRNALKVAEERGGRIVVGKNRSGSPQKQLRSAMRRYRYVVENAGLVGKDAPHAARYAYAQDCMRAFRAAGHTEKEARQLTSHCLGHGDGRDRWVASVYCRGMR